MKYSLKYIKQQSDGRQFAIGDIHGCFYTFKSLLEEKIKINKNDQVFLLGDLINRGSYSRLLLEYLMELKNANYTILPIKGNHERKLLLAYDCGFDFLEDFLNEYNSFDLLDGDFHTYLKFISSFEYGYELKRFILTHCGINNNGINPLNDIRGMFPEVNFDIDLTKIKSKIQIHGHLTQTISSIEESLKRKENRISIDSGCFSNNPELGYLCALNLNDLTLISQKKIDL